MLSPPNFSHFASAPCLGRALKKGRTRTSLPNLHSQGLRGKEDLSIRCCPEAGIFYDKYTTWRLRFEQKRVQTYTEVVYGFQNMLAASIPSHSHIRWFRNFEYYAMQNVFQLAACLQLKNQIPFLGAQKIYTPPVRLELGYSKIDTRHSFMKPSQQGLWTLNSCIFQDSCCPKHSFQSSTTGIFGLGGCRRFVGSIVKQFSCCSKFRRDWSNIQYAKILKDAAIQGGGRTDQSFLPSYWSNKLRLWFRVFPLSI